MTRTPARRNRALASLLLGPVLAAGCSGPQEDVRISFCKQLVLTQVGTPASVRWTRVAATPHGYDGLSVDLAFEIQGSGPATGQRRASCRYRYNAVDDTALTLSNPLSAYATSPEAMTIDDEPLTRSALAAAVKTAMLEQGRAVIGRVQKGIEDAAGQIQERLKGDRGE